MIPPVEIITILQILLLGHKDWFERQQYCDCLAPLLGIDKLLQNSSDVLCKVSPVEPESSPCRAQEATREGTAQFGNFIIADPLCFPLLMQIFAN